MTNERRATDAIAAVTDPAVRTALEEIEKGYLRRADANRDALARLARRTYVLLAVCIVVSFAGGVVSASLEFSQSGIASKADRAALQAKGAADDARRIARESVKTAGLIQQSRLSVIDDQCRAQNKNHDATIAALGRAAATAPRQPGQTAAQKAQGVAAFVFIINAETPKRDCKAVVAAATLKPVQRRR